MKTYGITFSKEFPPYHKKCGEPTNFVEKIMSGEKIHVILNSPMIWEDRFRDIYSGKACLSLRYWSGKQNRSKQIEFLRLTKDDGICLQPIIISDNRDYFVAKPFNIGEIITNADLVNISKTDEDLLILSQISKNDGLSVDDFKDWFKGRQFVGVIINLTNFKY
jgi:hypothetical protein